MNSRRPLALALAIILTTPGSGSGQEPRAVSAPQSVEAATPPAVHKSEREAPVQSAPLLWQGPSGKGTSGYWYPDPMVLKIATRVKTCEANQAKLVDDVVDCRMNLAVETAKSKLSWKFWLPMIGVGIAAGFAAGKKLGK